jgi:hypothetical protein
MIENATPESGCVLKVLYMGKEAWAFEKVHQRMPS